MLSAGKGSPTRTPNAFTSGTEEGLRGQMWPRGQRSLSARTVSEDPQREDGAVLWGRRSLVHELQGWPLHSEGSLGLSVETCFSAGGVSLDDCPLVPSSELS